MVGRLTTATEEYSQCLTMFALCRFISHAWTNLFEPRNFAIFGTEKFLLRAPYQDHRTFGSGTLVLLFVDFLPGSNRLGTYELSAPRHDYVTWP